MKKKNNNPARRAGEKNNLALILSEKNFLARTKIPSPPPPSEYQMDRALVRNSAFVLFVLYLEMKGHGSRVNLVKREALHTPVSFHFPIQRKKCSSILIFMLKRQITHKK